MEASATPGQAQAAAPAGEPAPGAKREADAEAEAPNAKRPNSEVLRGILQSIPDAKTQEAVVDFMGELMRTQKQQRESFERQRGELAELHKQKNTYAENMEAMSRQNGDMLAHILNKLLSQNKGAPLQNEDMQKLTGKLSHAFAKDDELFKLASRVVPVACSNLDNMLSTNEARATEHSSAMRKLDAYKTQLDEVGRWDSAAHGSPFAAPAAPAPARAPPPRAADGFAAPPPITVNAPPFSAAPSLPDPAFTSSTIQVAASNMEQAVSLARGNLPSWIESEVDRIDSRM